MSTAARPPSRTTTTVPPPRTAYLSQPMARVWLGTTRAPSPVAATRRRIIIWPR
jgi:hypothetical protein